MIDRQKLILANYRAVTGIDKESISDIPIDALLWFNRFSDKELAKPIIIEYLVNTNKSRAQIASYFSSDEITPRYVRTIGECTGRFKPK